MDTTFIEPEFYIFREISELLSEDDEYVSFNYDLTSNFTDILNGQNIFIFGKPGVGKTRLIKETINYSKELGKRGIFIDTKLCESDTIESKIKSNFKKTYEIEDIKLEKDLFVGLDALDEVKYDNFLQTIKTISELSNKFPNVQFISSCRKNYLRKHKDIFLKTKFRALELQPFNYEKLNRYLINNNFTEQDIEQIVNLLSSKNRELLIRIPRYLEIIVIYLKNNDIESLDVLSKSALLEHVIYKHLEVEANKTGYQHIDIIKRTLEKLALVLEIFQTNVLTKDDLLTFFDDINSDLKYYFIERKGYEILFDKTALKDNIDNIEFENTEFQECLAAKELSRLSSNSRLIFNICVNPDIQEIYPSWLNTLKYLTEISPKFLKPLIKYGFQNRLGGIHDEEYFRFITNTNVFALQIDERRSIFKLIFSYHQNLPIWIDSEIASNLAMFFDTSLNNELTQYMDNRKKLSHGNYKFVRQGNVARIVGNLFKLKIFNTKEKSYWKQKLLAILENQNNSYAHRRDAIFALKLLNDKKILPKVLKYWKSADQLLKQSMISYCKNVDPNSKKSIDIYLSAIKSKIIGSRSAINSISNRDSIKYFFNKSLEDNDILSELVKLEAKDLYQLLISIEQVWNKALENIILNFIVQCFSFESYFDAKSSSFIFELAKISKSKSDNFITNLLTNILSKKNGHRKLFFMEDLFAYLIEPDDIKIIYEILSTIQNGKNILFQIIFTTKLYHRETFDKYYTTGKSYLESEYNLYEKNRRKPNKGFDRTKETYKRFQIMLTPEPNKYSTGVFQFYLDNKEAIERYITKAEKERMIELIKGSILEKFDPGQHDLTLKNVNNGNKTYTTHSFIHIFGDILILSKELKIPIKKYRSKIINYIPFAYHEHLRAIFHLVPDINESDINKLISIYNNTTSDLWKFMPENFITACERYNIKRALPLLKFFITVSDFSVHIRRKALRTCESLHPDRIFLSDISKNYSKSTNTEEISIHNQANELLISIYGDHDAIQWRISQIIQRKFVNPLKKHGVHTVSVEENELWELTFAKPLLSLNASKYIQYFDELLEASFEILIDYNYSEYAQYLWKITIAFYGNLKEEGSFNPLKHLDTFINKYRKIEGVNWFYYKFIQLKREYLSYLGKPRNIYDCITIYNNIKNERYHNITRNREFIEKTKEILNDEVRNWVENEGAYSLIVNQKILDAKKQQYETLIQKTIVSQIKYAFMKNGFAIEIIREPQLLDDRRIDILINYGFFGPIIIELKLSTSPDISFNTKIEDRKSYKRYKQYLRSHNAIFGIFLVIDNKPRSAKTAKWDEHLSKIEQAFNKIERTEVIGFEAILS